MRGSAGGVDSSDGALVSSSNAAGSSMATRFAQDKILLEDFNVRTLFDKLQDQTILVMSQLRDHETSAKYIYEQIAAETFKMKQLLEQQKEAENAQLLTQGDLPDNVSLDDVRRELDSEIQHRENFGKEFDHLASKISRLMEEAQGAAGMSSGFPEEELRRLEEAIDSLESESDHLRRSCQHESNRRHSVRNLRSLLFFFSFLVKMTLSSSFSFFLFFLLVFGEKMKTMVHQQSEGNSWVLKLLRIVNEVSE